MKKRLDFIEKKRYNWYLRKKESRTGGVTMPNIKSSKKDVIRSKIAYEKNKADKSEMKTVIKKYEAALAGGDRAAAEVAYKDAIVIVDKAVTKGILHKNTAARKKSSMTLQLNKLA
jgi:small subunit ribosomal protein S20